MKFYKKLEYDLLHHPNASWFNFDPRKLEIPDILSAPGLQKIDFDRLSVAFGLSFPNVGQNVPGRLAPPQKPRTRDYSDRFIDKDMV